MNWSLLSRVSLTVADSRQVSETLSLIVNGLVDEAGFGLARIWLIETEGSERILRLRASAGSSVSEPGRQWNSLDGSSSRIPLGQRKVGWVAMTGESVLIEDVTQENSWIADPAWALKEGMVSFAAHPLVFKGEVAGVLGAFTREHWSRERLQDLRLFADHAAVSLANARAFEELEGLRGKLELENAYLQEEVKESIGHATILGRSPSLQRVLQQIELVAPTDATVLILGESGTGKELVARAIHDRSRRHARALVKVNCASIPRELFESEFFGHAKGSFTGAIKDRVGRFQLADRGTLFLDEVGEIPLELQSKLLRVLQENEFERVGEDLTRKVDVRVIAASNRDLAKTLREDLYYRLSVFPIVVPPLRERREDIPQLAVDFISQVSRRMGIAEVQLAEKDVRRLTAYDWPGNIRELQHVMERGVILGQGRQLVIDLPGDASVPRTQATAAERIFTMAEFRQLEIRNYIAALKQAGGKIYGEDGAAALLGMPPTTLSSRIKALGILHS